MLYNEQEYKQYMKKRNRLTDWAAVLGLAGFMAVYLAAGTDDARTIYNDKTVASEKTTIPMAIGGSASVLAATALLAIRNKKIPGKIKKIAIL